MLRILRKVLKDWRHLRGMMAGGLTGLKDRGIEDAGKGTKDLGLCS